jgi:hypothetical protein
LNWENSTSKIFYKNKSTLSGLPAETLRYKPAFSIKQFGLNSYLECLAEQQLILIDILFSKTAFKSIYIAFKRAVYRSKNYHVFTYPFLQSERLKNQKIN